MVVNEKKVSKNMDRLRELINVRAALLMERLCAECENYAKAKAPWTDRTGNARNSIYGRLVRKEKEVVGAVGIGVDYGVYLELAHHGKYKIIWPTVEAHKRKLFEIAKLPRL